jgi:hypothetical protein
VKDAVAVLKSPKLEGGQLTFDVVVLEGDLANTRPDLRHCSSTGSRPVADLAAWVLSVASAFMPQSGMLAGMPTLELHLQQELQSVQSGSQHAAGVHKTCVISTWVISRHEGAAFCGFSQG